MRRTTAIVVVGAALLLIAAWLAIRSWEGVERSSPESRAGLSPPAPAPGFAETPVSPRGTDPLGSQPAPALPSTEAASEAEDGLPLPADLAEIVAHYRGAETPEERERALLELALTDEPESLSFLLDELDRVDEDQRESVLSAVVQFGSREAVPRLRQLALEARSPDEARRLTEAADYLELPSLTEIRRRLREP
jgi:hypothetical protein